MEHWAKIGESVFFDNFHYVKSVSIGSFSGLHSTVFIPNAGKCGPEKLRIWTLFTQCLIMIWQQINLLNVQNAQCSKAVFRICYVKRLF